MMCYIKFMPASEKKLSSAVLSVFILLSLCYRILDGLFWGVKYKYPSALLDMLLYTGQIHASEIKQTHVYPLATSIFMNGSGFGAAV